MTQCDEQTNKSNEQACLQHCTGHFNNDSSKSNLPRISYCINNIITLPFLVDMIDNWSVGMHTCVCACLNRLNQYGWLSNGELLDCCECHPVADVEDVIYDHRIEISPRQQQQQHSDRKSFSSARRRTSRHTKQEFHHDIRRVFEGCMLIIFVRVMIAKVSSCLRRHRHSSASFPSLTRECFEHGPRNSIIPAHLQVLSDELHLIACEEHIRSSHPTR